ncbi:hypothetical protein ACUHMQ_14655 [Chitinimonas sp. PSY-7]|uniref:hypothetical protein n=1 Tax=Chitinimonas sp. PSY-7 TaxID=3459088 RepID=UPI00403FD6DB
MSLTTRNWVTQAGYPQTGPALPTLPPAAQAGVSNAIGELQANQLFGLPGPTNVTGTYGWRIDRQNAPAGFVNLSVQRNGVGAPSTVASVFLPTTFNIAPGPGGPAAQPFASRISELLRAVRRGLEESFATYVAGPPAQITRKEITGNFSS